MTALAWTIPEIEALTRDWLAGLSATLIGLKLQRSRNSVAGKVHRLGLPLGTTQRVKATAPAKPQSEPKPEPKPKPVVKKVDDVPLPPSKPVRLFDLRRKHCRALLDTSDDRNPLFCGAPVVRGERGQRTSYCAKHYRLFHKRSVP
jgi:GcrA cell cycle regulator